MTQLLHDNITGGTGTAAYTGCGGQAGKTGTTDNYTDAWFAGYQPNLATAVWVGYPQSNEIEMTSVHGTTVFGGTFPAEIWNSLYANGEVPCEEFDEPETPISWAPYYGEFTQAEPSSDDSFSEEAEEGEEESEAEKTGQGSDRRLRPRRLRARRRPGADASRPLPARRPRPEVMAVGAPESAAARRPAGSAPDSLRRRDVPAIEDASVL